MAKLPEPFDAELWLVENAIREHRKPPTDDLLVVLRRHAATPTVYQYLAALNEGKPFSGRKPITLGETVERMDRAIEQVRAELDRARKSGKKISLTKAVELAAARPNTFNKTLLWEMIALYRAHYDREEI